MRTDYHIHTTQSLCCSDKNATPEGYLNLAAEQGLDIIGFTNHCWDEAVPLKTYYPSEDIKNWALDFYRIQNIDHVLSMKKEIPENPKTPYLVGCETDYCGNGVIGMTEESAKKFDYILLATTHFHMHGFTCPPGLSDEEVAKLCVDRFIEGCNFAFVDGIVHPFFPLGHNDNAGKILSLITEDDWQRCALEVAKHKKAVEINGGVVSLYRSQGADRHYGIFFQMAAKEGVRIFYSSDTHSVADQKWLLDEAKSFAEKYNIPIDHRPFG